MTYSVIAWDGSVYATDYPTYESALVEADSINGYVEINK